jgi:hypothetical protein
MRWDLAASAAVALGSMLWLAAGPKTLKIAEAARFERPPARPGAVDDVQRLSARLEHSKGLMLFPAVVVPAPGASVAPAPSNLRLRGTSISSNRRAALVSADGAAARWVAIGETGDLQLLELSDTRAVLRISSGEVVALDLFKPPEEVATGALSADD